jgi:hypothetical protein
MPSLDSLPAAKDPRDSRDLKSGTIISDRNGYYDSQNIVAVNVPGQDHPTLSVVLHHSENREGGPGLRLFGARSFDQGRSWTPLAAIEPDPDPQSHDGYQLVQRRPGKPDRIFVFYGCNSGAHPSGQTLSRTDMQLDEGYYFRFSDDAGAHWSRQRGVIPVRRTRIDRENPWEGQTIGMFLCDKPSSIDGAVYMAFQKTPDGAGETAQSEVFFLCSKDFLQCDDPTTATWETRPEGDDGLCAPGGTLALGEEPHVLGVGQIPGRLFCLWRTETGKLAASYSSDGGKHWESSFWLNFAGSPQPPQGSRCLRNPRGAITPCQLRTQAASGATEYALLFYNNGRTERSGYCGRRVLWLTTGRSTEEGHIRWHQPEVVLWWDGPGYEDRGNWNEEWSIVDGPGYADWLEDDLGRLSFVQSNKLGVRYHVVEPRLLELLRHQPELGQLPEEAKSLDIQPSPAGAAPVPVNAPSLVDLHSRGGFTIVLQLRGSRESMRPGEAIVEALSTITAARGEGPTEATLTRGYSVRLTDDLEVELLLRDGCGGEVHHASNAWGHPEIWDDRSHALAFICDGGPRILSTVVDEVLDDGGHTSQGWSFLPTTLGDLGGDELVLSPEFGGHLERFLIYDRPLTTSEAISASRALTQQAPIEPGLT